MFDSNIGTKANCGAHYLTSITCNKSLSWKQLSNYTLKMKMGGKCTQISMENGFHNVGKDNCKAKCEVVE